MEGLELEKFVTNCLEWARRNGYIPETQASAPGWMKLSSGETFTSNQLYLLYLVEVLKQSLEFHEHKLNEPPRKD